MSKLVGNCMPEQLWVPGMNLTSEYPVATNQGLEAAWAQYHPSGQATAMQSAYGVYAAPTQEVKAVASIDLCEVVRDSVRALRLATGEAAEANDSYAKGTWYDKEIVGEDYEYSVIASTLQVLMGAGEVRPVAHASTIGAILRNWRQQGIYTVANTSTLPGCELGTIQHTIGRDLPNAFDAIVLPRNYDGKGPMTKAAALALLANETSINLGELPIIHIDDAPHHITGFQEHYPDARLTLFMPRHSENKHTYTELQCETPLAAFMKADRYFVEEEVITYAW